MNHTAPSLPPETLRVDHAAFAVRVKAGARILDVGCGDGELMAYLEKTKQVDVRGLEITEIGVARALARGLSVIQGDAETDLTFFPDNGFDYAILSRTIDALKQPKAVLRELARIAPDILLSFQNHGYWKTRLSAAVHGRIPDHNEATKWFDTNRLHLLSLRDVLDLAAALNLVPVAFIATKQPAILRTALTDRLLNLSAKEIVLHLRRKS